MEAKHLQEPSADLPLLDPIGRTDADGHQELDPLNLCYPGSKGLAGLREWVLGQFPDHINYAEPFAGKAAIYRRKPPSLNSVLIDRDARLCTWLRSHVVPGTRIIHGDGLRWLELVALFGITDLLIYADPPYMLETRTHKRLYRHELSLADHTRLLNAVQACRCPVFLSGYASPLYLERLEDWHCATRWVITRGRTLRQEHLWNNLNLLGLDRPSTGLQLQYSHLGDNWRARDQLNQKRKRWAAKFAKMPAHEQEAILRELLATFQQQRRSLLCEPAEGGPEPAAESQVGTR